MPDAEDSVTEAGPLTVVATWRVSKGQELAFEAWRHEIAAATAFPGHMGVNVIRPAGEEREYVVIFRFDTYDHLLAWQESPIRWALLKKAEPLRDHPPSYRSEKGLEFWFTAPGRPAAPPRWKMLPASVSSGTWAATASPSERFGNEALPHPNP